MDTSIFIGTWWSLVPPLLAIILALVTKEVYSSLFIGVAGGGRVFNRVFPGRIVECIQCPVFDYERQHESEYSDF